MDYKNPNIMSENKISVVINTYNEEASLADTLPYLKEFDEIVVCDMESTDDTIKIAQQHGCKVVTFPKGNYNICEPARDFAIHSASNNWVLVVDADEIITPKLRQYLYDFIQNEKNIVGLLIPRKNYVMNRFVKNSYPDYQLRFFRQDKATWKPIIHSKPILNGTIKKIPSEKAELAIIHKSMTIYSRIAKINTYTTNEVTKRENERVCLLSLFLKPTLRFLKFYLLKGGIFQGISGLTLSVNEANYKFYTLVKIWEAQNEKRN